MGAAQGPSDTPVPHHRHRAPDAPPRRSRLRIADWRMRTKLATVLIIPSLAFLVLAGAQTVSLAGEATALREFAREVAVGRQITDLVHGLQLERDRTAGELAAFQTLPGTARNLPALAASLQPQYDSVDDTASAFRLAAAPLAGGRAAWRVSYGRVVEELGQLPQVRAAVAGGAVSPATVLDDYGQLIESLLRLLAEPAPGVEEPALTEAVLRYVNLARVKEVGSRIRAKLYQAASAGRYGPTDLVELSDLRAQQLSAFAEFQLAATGEQLRRYDAAAADAGFRKATELEESTIAGTTVLAPQPWWQASQQRLDLLRAVEIDVLADAVAESDRRSSAQLRQTLLVAGLILAVLCIALLTSVAIGRSIARSLRSLREHAMHVARDDLPDTLHRLRSVTVGIPRIDVAPAAVDSRDEVGEVAEAFLAVHRSAVDLAVEQAAMRRNVNSMFVNLARRSQVLVERQLELLDDLERVEADPDQLENLFKIDHLAARLRRNDESLLVLAGNEANRRWSEPVALSTVVLAAIAEIEFYPRVNHDTDEQLRVVGHAVADLVHLLAELLENATVFSPPTCTVLVTGRQFGAGAALLEITDEGLGMKPGALAEANALLASAPAADVAASERMGLFVVAHLAARQGIRVELRAAERGLVASVWLPPTLLAPAERAELPAGRPAALAASADAIPAGYHQAAYLQATDDQTGFDQARYDQATDDQAAHGYRAPGVAVAPYAQNRGFADPDESATQVVPTIGDHWTAGSRAVVHGDVVGPDTGPVVDASGTPVSAGGPPALGNAGVYGLGPARGNGGVYGGPVPGSGAPEIVYGGPVPVSAVPVSPVPLPLPTVPRLAGEPPDAALRDVPTTELRVVTVEPSAPGTVGDVEDLPVAGRRPRLAGVPRLPARPVPPRAENVLRAAGATVQTAGSAWWSRQNGAAAAVRPSGPPAAPTPPQVPVTGGFNANGLPVRVPMAQLQSSGETVPATSAYVPGQRAEPDPEAVGSVLSRFYGGVRRAELEETTELSMAPAGRRAEGNPL